MNKCLSEIGGKDTWSIRLTRLNDIISRDDDRQRGGGARDTAATTGYRAPDGEERVVTVLR